MCDRVWYTIGFHVYGDGGVGVAHCVAVVGVGGCVVVALVVCVMLVFMLMVCMSVVVFVFFGW